MSIPISLKLVEAQFAVTDVMSQLREIPDSKLEFEVYYPDSPIYRPPW